MVHRALVEPRLADIPEPEPGPGEALLRIRASGFCHTDIDILTGEYGDGNFPWCLATSMPVSSSQPNGRACAGGDADRVVDRIRRSSGGQE